MCLRQNVVVVQIRTKDGTTIFGDERDLDEWYEAAQSFQQEVNAPDHPLLSTFYHPIATDKYTTLVDLHLHLQAPSTSTERPSSCGCRHGPWGSCRGRGLKDLYRALQGHVGVES